VIFITVLAAAIKAPRPIPPIAYKPNLNQITPTNSALEP